MTATRFYSAVRDGARSWRLACEHVHDRLETADSCAMARGVPVIVIQPADPETSETPAASEPTPAETMIVTAPYIRARRRARREQAPVGGNVVRLSDRRRR